MIVPVSSAGTGVKMHIDIDIALFSNICYNKTRYAYTWSTQARMISLPVRRQGSFRLFAVIGTLLMLSMLVVVSTRVHAASSEAVSRSGRHVLTIHDGANEKGIFTEADTLGDALKEAGVVIDDNDVTEPRLDEKLVAATYEVNIYRARPVVVVDGFKRTKVITPYQTAKQIAKQANIELHDEDNVTFGASSDIMRDGALETLTIQRATPFTFVFYGKTIQSYTMAATVGEMLAGKNITLQSNDVLSVKASTPIVAGMKVELWRDGKQTVTREEKINYPVRQIKDADRPAGYRKIQTPGVKGEKVVTYDVVMKNGKELSKKAIKTVLVKEPKEQVEVVGTKIEGPEAIIAKIRAAAAAKGIDAQRVLIIAKCESGLNPRSDSGYYKGLFQHDPTYWAGRAAKYGFAGASYFDVDAQIAVSTSMMAGGGWSHWGCDPGPQ